MTEFEMPSLIADMVAARNELREHYRAMLDRQRSAVELKFTLDGNLVGDIGEALAAQLFGIRLVEAKSTEGIDGFAPDGRTVQVKATGTGRGPAFRCVETRADHLLFFDLDFDRCRGAVVYNGPEHYAVRHLPDVFANQRQLSRLQIRAADAMVRPDERLARIEI